MSKIVIGMSGGVDSSVTAYLLKKAGHEVYGVTMKTMKEGCEAMLSDAAQVAKQLGISHEVIDYCDTFKQRVRDYFSEEYLEGRTPNPCVVCNRYVKWESVLQYADSIGAEYMATGHYANIVRLPNGRYTVKFSSAGSKDQSYVLFRLTQEQLKRTIMPLGEYSKDKIRRIAAEAGLETAQKPDSQEICFIPDNDYAGYILRETGKNMPEGNYVDAEGKVLGRHKGILHYTVGQRKGLGIAFGEPRFVLEIRKAENEVVLGTGEEVFSDSLCADNINYMGVEQIKDGEEFTAKIRYSHKGALCRVYNQENGSIKCEFKEPQRAVTPGQSVVLYKEGMIMAGGRIIK